MFNMRLLRRIENDFNVVYKCASLGRLMSSLQTRASEGFDSVPSNERAICLKISMLTIMQFKYRYENKVKTQSSQRKHFVSFAKILALFAILFCKLFLRQVW